jgi:hypothetical protein
MTDRFSYLVWAITVLPVHVAVVEVSNPDKARTSRLSSHLLSYGYIFFSKHMLFPSISLHQVITL